VSVGVTCFGVMCFGVMCFGVMCFDVICHGVYGLLYMCFLRVSVLSYHGGRGLGMWCLGIV
jgi:hypothetical protein